MRRHGQGLAYLDFGGSHAETLAQLRENGRITLMWCAFTGPPMDHREDRTLHADFFGRRTDAEFADYSAAKEHNGASIDGLPALPPPLPARTA